MFLKPCSSCSHAFSLAVLKKKKKKQKRNGVFSWAPSLWEVVVRGAAAIQPLSLPQELRPCRPCLLLNLPGRCRWSNVPNETVLLKGAKVSRVWNSSSKTQRAWTASQPAQLHIRHRLHSPAWHNGITLIILHYLQDIQSPETHPEVRSNYVCIANYPVSHWPLFVYHFFNLIWSFPSFVILSLNIAQAIRRPSLDHMLCDW